MQHGRLAGDLGPETRMQTKTKITESQRKATAAFHLRMAKAFRAVGREADAKAAEDAAAKLDSQSKE